MPTSMKEKNSSRLARPGSKMYSKPQVTKNHPRGFAHTILSNHYNNSLGEAFSPKKKMGLREVKRRPKVSEKEGQHQGRIAVCLPPKPFFLHCTRVPPKMVAVPLWSGQGDTALCEEHSLSPATQVSGSCRNIFTNYVFIVLSNHRH